MLIDCSIGTAVQNVRFEFGAAPGSLTYDSKWSGYYLVVCMHALLRDQNYVCSCSAVTVLHMP
jgi:hypothetical protein